MDNPAQNLAVAALEAVKPMMLIILTVLPVSPVKSHLKAKKRKPSPRKYVQAWFHLLVIPCS